MATAKHTTLRNLVKEDRDLMKELVTETLHVFLEAEMNELLGAAPSERSEARSGYRARYYTRHLTTRVGTLTLRVPRDREGRFSTELFERYQRSEKAFVAALAEMYIQGVSTRNVTAITEELCGVDISASTISAATKRLDTMLEGFANRQLTGEYPYVYLDARYNAVRVDGAVRSQALFIAVGIDTHGKRSLLAIETAERESEETWRSFLERLRERGCSGVRLVISDDHSGLRKSIPKILGSLWQRCSVHFMRNAITHAPKSLPRSCIDELKALYEAPSRDVAQQQLRMWVASWHDSAPSFVDYVESSIEETFTIFSFPVSHRRHMEYECAGAAQ